MKQPIEEASKANQKFYEAFESSDIATVLGHGDHRGRQN
jgi:hypothetical protein